MERTSIEPDQMDDKAVAKFLQGLQKPHRFLQKYLKETTRDDMVIISPLLRIYKKLNFYV